MFLPNLCYMTFRRRAGLPRSSLSQLQLCAKLLDCFNRHAQDTGVALKCPGLLSVIAHYLLWSVVTEQDVETYLFFCTSQDSLRCKGQKPHPQT